MAYIKVTKKQYSEPAGTQTHINRFFHRKEFYHEENREVFRVAVGNLFTRSKILT